MSDLEFYADVLSTGTILGLDSSCTPDQVTMVLGADFGEQRARGVLLRDFGLVEFTWERTAADMPWFGLRFTIQVHRLETAGSAVVNPVLQRAYGAFPATAAPFGRVRALLESEGWPLQEIPATDPQLREFWQPDSQTTVLLGSCPEVATFNPDELPLYQISAPLPPGLAAVRSAPRARRATRDRLNYLVLLSNEARLDWLIRRQPAQAEERPNWWLYYLQSIDAGMAQETGPWDRWITLKLWLIEQSESQGVFTTLDTVQRRAWFVATLHNRYAPLPAGAGIPDADTLVRECLTAIPGTHDDLARSADLRSHSRPELLRSRRANGLIRAAEQHRSRIRDPHLAAALDQWSALRPLLV